MSTTTTTTERKFVTIDVNNPAYNVGMLLDAVMAKLGVKNDAALSRELGVSPTNVSNIRNVKVALSAAMMIRIHDVADMSITTIRSFLVGPTR
ncbi:hypothetical protein RBA41_33330 [Massilia sp. CCM 9210]|uniref:hypothetical protein n=1 Tax=Massilia TaxID=149698 RepID=UPI0027969D32|nr:MULTISPECIES: hypothetical protein [unclassified Massilia]MDQ1818190.1 hypothetical protein [Massilia sp. CCM 9210]MDQ1924617.1 hypothetical protein [Massilia sp. CCM 9206]